ncbi:MAG TPA: NADH-quinone oxidoreductase subunit N [Actinobacteria bacterium]|nr:NADH-quinone oxidoreductase subunit N [Actinomycetota bacterium]
MIDYHALAPAAVLGLTVVAALVVDLVVRRKVWVAVVSLVGLFGAFVPLLTLAFCEPLLGCASTTRELFGGSYVVDGYALVLGAVFLATAFVAVLLSVDYIESDRYYEGEYFFLLLAAALGGVVMASARDFVTLIVALELVSGPGFLLAGWRKADERSNEAALKFFISGVLALALLVFGVSLVYGLTGTQLFAELAAVDPDVAELPLFSLGLLFVLVGFGFKVSAVPFHFWTPDTYQGAPTPVTAWLAVGSKTAGFVGLLSVVFLAFPQLRHVWGPMVWVVAAASMIVGNVVAIKQDHIVRLLGYSSIAHAGFILAPIAAMAGAPAEALPLAFYAAVAYLLVYAVMNLGAFGVAVAGIAKVGSGKLSSWRGLFRHSPSLAVMMAIFFFSLAGIPPLAGWFAKLAMFQAAVGADNPWGLSIAVVAVLNSVVAIYYYAKPVVAAFFEEAPAELQLAEAGAASSPAMRLALGLAVVGVLVLGVVPGVVAVLGRYTTSLLTLGG